MLSVYPLPINFWMPEPIFMKTAYFKHLSHQLCLYVYASIVVRYRLSKNVTAAMNTRANIEVLLDAAFSMRSVSYKSKGGD
jgi:hypothetical protein